MLLNVRTMTCQHCVRSVTAAVRTLDPGARVEVDLVGGTVRVDDSRADAAATAEAIRAAGYEVEVVQR